LGMLPSFMFLHSRQHFVPKMSNNCTHFNNCKKNLKEIEGEEEGQFPLTFQISCNKS